MSTEFNTSWRSTFNQVANAIQKELDISSMRAMHWAWEGMVLLAEIERALDAENAIAAEFGFVQNNGVWIGGGGSVGRWSSLR